MLLHLALLTRRYSKLHFILKFTLFATGKNHINGIENFWNQAKRVLRKYNGIPKESFPLYPQGM